MSKRPALYLSFGTRLRLAFYILIRGKAPAYATHIGDQITSLEEEFSDLFLSRKKFIHRLVKVACTDLPDFNYANGRTAETRIKALRHTTVMPSVAIAELCREFTLSDSSLLRFIDFRLNRRRFGIVAHKVGVTIEFLLVCCKTEVNLDDCWRIVRNELLKLRIAYAQSDGELFDSVDAELASKNGGK